MRTESWILVGGFRFILPLFYLHCISPPSTAEGREHVRAEERQGTEAPELTLPGGKLSRDYFLTAQHDFGNVIYFYGT